MEEGQRHNNFGGGAEDQVCLNPCCNGRGSKTQPLVRAQVAEICLNPCCNGRGSKTLLVNLLMTSALMS